jgi:apolipoprotein N-acyltransferase
MMRLVWLLASAGLHALAFPPWNHPALAWVALVPFLWALRGLRPAAGGSSPGPRPAAGGSSAGPLPVGSLRTAKSDSPLDPRAGALAGLIWGSAAIWAVAAWVPAALTFYYQQPWWFGLLFCLIGSMALWGLYYAVFAAVMCWGMPRLAPLARPWFVATVWVACELGRARLLTGEPWMLLGYALVPNVRLIQAADLGGVYLLSFVVSFVNASLHEALCDIRPSARRAGLALCHTAAAAVVVSALWGYGAWRLAQPLPQTPAVSVAVIQGNNDLGAQWRPEFYGQGLDVYLRQSAAAIRQSPAALLVWPESAVTFFLAHEPLYQTQIAHLLAVTGADLLVGAPHFDDRDQTVPRYFNSAFYLTADRGITGRYDKGHLLPFAEYFPLRFIAFLRRHFERVRTFTPGNGSTLLDTRIGKAAVVICFEALFPELVREQMARGAAVLVNLSNDVWLGARAGPEQHASMVRLRAVENRTWVIRATTTGVSAIIDPFGRVRAESPIFAAATLRGEIVPLHVSTVYKGIGDLFAYGCVLASGLICLVCWRRRPR